jgi:hypothetical protein
MCFFANPIVHPSVMFRAQLIKNLGGYNDAYVTSQDYNLWSRAALHTRLANVQNACLHLRKHGENISQLKYQQQQQSSLEIGASVISRVIQADVKPSQIQSYCSFLWDGTQMNQYEVSFIAGLIFQLSKVFLDNPQMIYPDRLWIVNNAIARLNILKQKLKLPLVVRMKLCYWIWSLKGLA